MPIHVDASPSKKKVLMMTYADARHALHLLLFLTAIAFFSNLSSVADDEARPNLILIYTDDQRFDAVAENGNPLIDTPNLDRLAQNGVRFTNAHAVMALCSPSRAAALTGRYGSGNGVTGLAGKLNPGEVTFAQLLQESGYQTAFVGKWHLKDRVPDTGFDFRCYFQGNGTYYGRQVWDQGHHINPEQHVDAYCVDRSVSFLESTVEQDEPFVLFHATQLPHMDHRHSWPSRPEIRATYDDDLMPLPETWRGDLTDKPPYLESVRNRTQALGYGYDRPEVIRAHAGDYYAVVTHLDAILGELFDTMTDLNLWENTWVVFMSDNGWMLGEHGFTSKVLPYDPSMRVPLCVLGPDLAPRVENRIALNIDIAPIFLDLANVEIPSAMHGSSLTPILLEEECDWRESFVYECIGGYGGTRPLLGVSDGSWKLLYTWDDASEVATSPPSFVELYDLINDPEETSNLAEETRHTSVRQRLGEEIERHIAEHLSNEAECV
jgi:arylsulfatase A-like enzyme